MTRRWSVTIASPVLLPVRMLAAQAPIQFDQFLDSVIGGLGRHRSQFSSAIGYRPLPEVGTGHVVAGSRVAAQVAGLCPRLGD